MFAKLIVVILSIGVVACVLLTVRQQRMQAVHELANVQREVARLDRTLAHLRLEVAERITPERVNEMAKSIGVELRPIGVPDAPVTPPTPSGPVAPGATNRPTTPNPRPTPR